MIRVFRFDKSILRRFLCRAILGVGLKVDRPIRAILERYRGIVDGVSYRYFSQRQKSLDLVDKN